MSVVVRLPEDMYESAKRIAALQGRSPADLLTDAWEQYLVVHREELATGFEEAAELLRAGDTEGLATLASRSADARAAAAVAARSE